MDVPSFLRMYPPFDDLDDERLAEVVGSTHIEFFPEGTVIVQESGEPSRFLYIVRRGAVEVLEDDDLVDVLGEGEVFGFVSLLSGVGPSFSVRAREDAICYLIDKEIAEDVMSSRRGLTFLASAFRRRDQRALGDMDRERVDHRRAPVATLVHRRPLTMPATASIRQAAELMADEREGYVLLEAAGGTSALSIVTDRDLRTRVLAQGTSPEEPASTVASSPVVAVNGESTMAEVVALMLERGIHHIPVQGPDGRLLGVVTDVDLLAAEQLDAFALRRGIERANDRALAIEAFRSAPGAASRLVEARVDALEVAHVLAVATDALTIHLLEFGIHELGEPPCPWAWLALGSQARQEQSLVMDQEHALLFDDRGADPAEVDPYFERLSVFVTAGLEEAGVSGHGSEMVATHADRRGGLGEWQRRVRASIADPAGVGSQATAAIDSRRVAGPLDAGAALDGIIRSAREHPDFIRSLGGHVVSARSPRGLLKDGVVQAKATTAALDIEQAGIRLITGVARLVAVMSGLTENRTARRLRDVATLGWLSQDECQGLEEAFRLMWQVRFEHQARQVRLGMPVDDLVEPAMLGPLTRQALKESFRMIDRAQSRLGALVGVRR